MPVNEDIESYYRMLDLSPDATLEDAKESWRDLVKIWHPDRFASDPRLQQKCQDKLKQINNAYEALQKILTDERPVYRPVTIRCQFCGRPVGPEETLCGACKPLFHEESPVEPAARPSSSVFTRLVRSLVIIGAVWICARSLDQHGDLSGEQILLLVALLIGVAAVLINR